VAEDGLKYLHETHAKGEDKYTYFLLSVTAAAVAFSVQKTDTSVITWTLIPMALAVLTWGLSFYCGCKNLGWVQTATSANYNLLQLRAGTHPEQPPHPQAVQAAIRGVGSALAHNINRAQFYAKWQFRLLLLGAGFFLVWHITGIIVRTLH
jgi:hypothetical protein